METPRLVRSAAPTDAAACAAIYSHYVLNTAVTFESVPPTPVELESRIRAAQDRHAWLVLEADGVVVGYAYATAYRTRPAYRFTCETSVYLDPAHHGTGGGRALYSTLLPVLAERGFRQAVAGIALPNDASIGLHRTFGFDDVGIFRKVGWKHDAWHDVAFLQVELSSTPPG